MASRLYVTTIANGIYIRVYYFVKTRVQCLRLHKNNADFFVMLVCNVD